MFNGDDENASIFEHCFVVLSQRVHMECCVREIEMAARSSFSRFFIYCQVFDCNPVDLFLQVHFPTLSLFQCFCFPFGVLWNPTNSWTQFINLFLVKRSSIACFIYQCFESCDMKTWLVINIVLIPQTCIMPCAQFSHAQLFLKNLIARLPKKRCESRYASNLFSWFMVKDLPFSVHPSPLGISHRDALIATTRQKNCSKHWTYHPLSCLSIDSYMREQQSRSILHTNQTNLNPSPFSFEILSKCHNTFCWKNLNLNSAAEPFFRSLTSSSFFLHSEKPYW